MNPFDRVSGALFGLCTADALGLPCQFRPREYFKNNPVRTMTGYGVFDKPPGTWSDDSSLTFCLAESLCGGYDLNDLAARFIDWLDNGYWSADGQAFDIGRTCLAAIARLHQGIPPTAAGLSDERSIGNGSLMRILPLAFHLDGCQPEDVFERTHQVSALTHAHPAAQMACGIYIQLALGVLSGTTMARAFQAARQSSQQYYRQEPFAGELHRFEHIFGGELAALPEGEIHSSGYAVHTLEAALWCLLNHSTYEDTVLTAVNLGGDTDSVAAVAGGIAGMVYGYASIPEAWLGQLARKEEIHQLVRRFYDANFGKGK